MRYINLHLHYITLHTSSDARGRPVNDCGNAFEVVSLVGGLCECVHVAGVVVGLTSALLSCSCVNCLLPLLTLIIVFVFISPMSSVLKMLIDT